MRKLLDYLSLTLLRKIEIRYRLINSFVLVSLLPLVMAGVIAYRESSQASQEKIRTFASEIVKQVAQNMLQQIEKVEASSEELILSERLQTSLAGYYGNDPALHAAAYRNVTRALLDNYGSSEYINQKYLLDRQYRLIDAQVFGTLSDDVVRFAANAPRLKGQPYWHIYSTANGQRSVVMLRDVLLKGNNQRAGTLFIGIKPSHFSRIFESADLGYDSRIFVIDSHDGHLIVDAAQDNISDENRSDMALIEAIARNRASAVDESRSNFVRYRDQNKKQQLVTYAQIPHTEWLVVSTTPLDALNREVSSIRNKIILIGVLCFIVAFALSFIIARSISLPLQQLVGVMKETRAGNYHSRMSHAGNDEISVLAQRFNQMASKVSQHNDELEQQVAERTRALELANHQLEQLSTTDSLTGIANRRRFDAALDSEMRRAARSQKPLGLLMLDVDYFKNYNDQYGHLAGDHCLRTVAQILHNHSRRATDTAARYGGEEFAVIAADCDRDSVVQIAEHLRNAVAALQIPHSASPFGYVTCSVGIAIRLVDDNTDSESLLRMADAALYLAKSRGRNQVVLNDISGML